MCYNAILILGGESVDTNIVIVSVSLAVGVLLIGELAWYLAFYTLKEI